MFGMRHGAKTVKLLCVQVPVDNIVSHLKPLPGILSTVINLDVSLQSNLWR